MRSGNWNELGGVSQAQFRQDHKDLQMLFALHRHDRDAGAEDNAHAKGGVFGGGSGGGDGAKKCYGCGGEGHVRRDCPNKRKKTQDKRRCFHCNKVGHVASNCPKKPKP